MRSLFALTPALPVMTGMMGGICMASIGIPPWCIAIAGIMAVILYYPLRLHRVSVFAASIALGWALSEAQRPTECPPELHGSRHAVVAKVRECDVLPSGQMIKMDVLSMADGRGEVSTPTPFGCFARYANLVPYVAAGDTIAFSGYLLATPSYADRPGISDFHSALRNDGYLSEADIDWESLNVVSKGEGGWRAWTSGIREKGAMLLASSRLNGEAAALTSALVLGDTSALSSAIRDDFASAGISHILAISGMHLAIVLGMLSGAFYIAGASLYSRRAIIPMIAVIWIYAAVIDFPVPVVRAALMASIMLAARAVRREYRPINALCVAAIAILIADSRALFEVSFQLSFMAVAGIVILSKPLVPFTPKNHMWLWRAAYAVAVPLSATLFTLPVIAVWFGRIPLYFVAGNILLAWLAPVIVGGGCVYLALLSAGIDFGLMAALLNAVCRLISTMASALSLLPYATLSLPPVRIAAIAAYIAALGCLTWWLHSRRRAVGLTAAAGFICTWAVTLWPTQPPHKEEAFVLRSAYSSDVIVGKDGRVDIYTATPDSTGVSRCEAMAERWARGRSSELIEVKDGREPFQVVGRTMVILGANAPSAKGHVDYAVIDRKFRGRISSLATLLSPDTLMLATNLPTSRRMAYRDSCVAAGIPVIDLRERPWMLVAH